MSRCGVWFAVVRWWRLDPTYGHEVMWPTRTSDGTVLQCARCLRVWPVAE
jgi:hypothetical protein